MCNWGRISNQECHRRGIGTTYAIVNCVRQLYCAYKARRGCKRRIPCYRIYFKHTLSSTCYQIYYCDRSGRRIYPANFSNRYCVAVRISIIGQQICNRYLSGDRCRQIISGRRFIVNSGVRFCCDIKRYCRGICRSTRIYDRVVKRVFTDETCWWRVRKCAISIQRDCTAFCCGNCLSCSRNQSGRVCNSNNIPIRICVIAYDTAT